MLDAWTAEVAELTRGWREMRARALAAAGKKKRREWAEHVDDVVAAAQFRAAASEDPYPTLDQPLPVKDGGGAWHFARARGHRERFQRVDDCQRVETIEVQCGHCSHTSTRGARCRCALACVSCRGKISHEKRSKLAQNRRAAIDLASRRGLTRTRRQGRWSEKLVTLTVPHFPELGCIDRIRFVGAAWRWFAKTLNLWLKTHPDGGHVDRQGHRLVRWFRSLEWTTGAEDEQGHPHVHFWFFGPYLPGGRATDDPKDNTIRNMWRDAIRKAAQSFDALAERIGPARYPRRPAPTPPGFVWRKDISGLDQIVCDVRAIRPGKESLREVIKYLFKDTGRYGASKLDPETWAQVYEGFDGARTTQGSRGLMQLAQREHAMTGFIADPRTGELRAVEVEDLRELRVGCACGHCGARPTPDEPWRVRRRAMSEDERLALDARRPLRKAAQRTQTTFYDRAIQ